jgi:hypothetical protein
MHYAVDVVDHPIIYNDNVALLADFHRLKPVNFNGVKRLADEKQPAPVV